MIWVFQPLSYLVVAELSMIGWLYSQYRMPMCNWSFTAQIDGHTPNYVFDNPGFSRSGTFAQERN